MHEVNIAFIASIGNKTCMQKKEKHKIAQPSHWPLRAGQNWNRTACGPCHSPHRIWHNLKTYMTLWCISKNGVHQWNSVHSITVRKQYACEKDEMHWEVSIAAFAGASAAQANRLADSMAHFLVVCILLIMGVLTLIQKKSTFAIISPNHVSLFLFCARQIHKKCSL